MSWIRIILGDRVVTAKLGDSRTAWLVTDALPFGSGGQLWGDAVYFSMPATAGEEHARPSVRSGVVVYWLPGKALCLFFGQKPCAPLIVVRRLRSDPNVLGQESGEQGARVEST